ncbi:MAG: purine-nucleoside phosphorylase [bacterium]|nr:purine-nucleoside phosphorylase [bacterium]
MSDHQFLAESIDYLKQKILQPPAVAIILGSGLGALADELQQPTIISCNDIPNYPVSTVPGHAGVWVSGKLEGVSVLAMRGRVHTYEGYSASQVALPVRLMAGLGISRLIVTNAAGGVNKAFQPGDLMLITDHINFMFDNPLIGETAPADQRFVDLHGAYDPKYIEQTKRTAKTLNTQLKEGVLLTARGPAYETAAEVNMTRILGADAVTMSTVPEVIIARQLKMRVLGISCITNMATGISGQKLSHAEVQQTADSIKTRFIALMKKILTSIPNW